MAVLAVVVLSLSAGAWAASAKEKALKPNVAVASPQLIVGPSQKPRVRVGLFNCAEATLTAYRIDLEQIAPGAIALANSNPKESWSWSARLNKLDLRKLQRVATWTARAKKTYRDRWAGVESELPFTKPGAYAIVAQAKGAEARTFLVISRLGLLVKRSPDKILAWAVDADTGKPAEGQQVALYDTKGRKAVGKTDGDGLARFATTDLSELCYLALRGDDPAFALTEAPGRERPYQVYLFTDRPVYRPGHVVRFRGTVRAVSRRRYSFPKGLEVVHVKILAPRGSTVYEKDLELNKWGTFADDFELAPEPPLGRYQLQVQVPTDKENYSFSKTFEVLAYRKPEFQVKVDIPQKHYLGGETIPVTISADYYFGSPVSGGKLSYKVTFSSAGNRVPTRIISAAGLGTAGSAEVESNFEGEATLDEQGKFVLKVPTKYVPVDRYMTVEAEVSELALRPQTASAMTRITAASFNLSIFPETRSCVVGDTVVLQISTRDYDGKPVSAHVRVTIIERKQDRQHRTYEERTNKDVETDTKGEATVTFKPQRPGYYRVEAWARDEEGNPVFASTSFRVWEKGKQPPYLSLSADKVSYVPGDVAVIHVKTNQVGGWGLMTVEGEFLYNAVVKRIENREFDLRVPLREAHCPGVTVRLAVPREFGLRTDSVQLAVVPEDKKLDVVLTPDREGYEPGQKANWAVVVRDHAGRGLAAELGVGVVDTSVYALRPDNTASPFS
ncbi:MAG: hypothetical protein J7M26_05685, partial [Armatimonadetes bacterium]|nr:hypothetical protein [Armatimonadota bacterium]